MDHPVRFLRYPNPVLLCWTFWSIKYKEGKDQRGEELCKLKEDEAKFRILAFMAASQVKEPEAAI
jgi:hypothetical protein